jgi:hypothetical protein
LHKLTIFSILTTPELGEGGRCESDGALIGTDLTADYADVADNQIELAITFISRL